MPHLQYEEAIRSTWGAVYIAGLDEAGRGAIAGPVVAGAVILPLDEPQRISLLAGVDDSKKLSSGRRAQVYEIIVEQVHAFGIGYSSAAEIDQIGIIAATKRAMIQALVNLPHPAAQLLIDGRIRLLSVSLPQQSIIRGDSASLSIAAASILAKVSRDREMLRQHEQFPQYGFDKHKGYCTRDHEAALSVHGPCPIHRYSFAPIRQPLL